ncbi:MAG: TolC family protein [Gemmatimonadaceae bacterium]
MFRRIFLAFTCSLATTTVSAQTVGLSRADAIRDALHRGALLGVASADTALANAALTAARALPNPSLTANYSRDTPHYHASVDIPIDFPMLRSLRIRSSKSGVEAARLRYQFNRAMIAMGADTAYTRAVAARQHFLLSRRTALDADTLLHMAERRRDAGDASDLDVELARVNSGQIANITADDSLAMVSALVDLQTLVGLAPQGTAILPIDSLTPIPSALSPAARTLDEMAASLSLDAAAMNLRLQRRSVWSQFSVSVGVEGVDPSQGGPLPTFGFGIGLPLFDRNRGAIAQAAAEHAKAEAELALTTADARKALVHATRERESAVAKATRDASLIVSANRVASMSLTGYREGAMSLPTVLEAQRSAREVLAQYISDLAAAWIATAELRVFSIVPDSSTNPQ